MHGRCGSVYWCGHDTKTAADVQNIDTIILHGYETKRKSNTKSHTDGVSVKPGQWTGPWTGPLGVCCDFSSRVHVLLQEWTYVCVYYVSCLTRLPLRVGIPPPLELDDGRTSTWTHYRPIPVPTYYVLIFLYVFCKYTMTELIHCFYYKVRHMNNSSIRNSKIFQQYCSSPSWQDHVLNAHQLIHSIAGWTEATLCHLFTNGTSNSSASYTTLQRKWYKIFSVPCHPRVKSLVPRWPRCSVPS